MSDYLLEVIQPSGVRQHVMLGDDVVTLGRGYDRDVIVADEFLSARHLRFRVMAGGVEVVDEGSENGTRIEAGGAGRQPLEGARCLPAGSRIIAGNTLVVIRHRLEAVPAARSLRAEAHGGGGWREKHAWWVLLPVFLGLSWATRWLQLDERDNWSSGLAVTTSAAMAVTFWSSFWALVGKLLVHRAHFLHHLALACLGGISLFVVDYGREWFLFAAEHANPPAWSFYAQERWLVAALFCVLLFALLYAHLGVASLMRRPGRALVAFSMPGVMAALLVVQTLAGESKPREQSAMSEWMLPLEWRWARISSEQAFLAGLEDLDKRAAAEAARSPEWMLDFPEQTGDASGASE